MLVCSKRKSPPFVSWVPTLKSRWLSARGPLWCSPNRSAPDATKCGSSGIEIAKDCCNTANGNAAIAALSIERRSIFSILNPLSIKRLFNSHSPSVLRTRAASRPALPLSPHPTAWRTRRDQPPRSPSFPPSLQNQPRSSSRRDTAGKTHRLSYSSPGPVKDALPADTPPPPSPETLGLPCGWDRWQSRLRSQSLPRRQSPSSPRELLPTSHQNFPSSAHCRFCPRVADGQSPHPAQARGPPAKSPSAQTEK